MRRMVALIIVVFFAVSTVPAFAAEQAAKTDNLFQIVSDTLKPGPGKDKNKIKKIEKIHVFQSLANGINEGSAKAKGESLRTESKATAQK